MPSCGSRRAIIPGGSAPSARDTAVSGLFSRTEPRDIKLGLGIEKFDSEGRTIIADYGDFTLMSTVPAQRQGEPERLRYKMEYKEAFLDYANKLCALPVSQWLFHRRHQHGAQ